MGTLEIIGGIIMILASIAIVILVLFQESTKGSGITSLTGGDGSYYNKNQGRTMDAMLSRLTKICAAVFFAVGILIYVISVL